MVQLATWNDWGEATGIEPTDEFGYRDLEALQKLRRTHVDATFVFPASDLRLPKRVLQHRRKKDADVPTTVRDEIARHIASGEVQAARSQFDRLEQSRK